MDQVLIVFDVDSTLLSVESLDFAVERALAEAPDGPERARALSALTDRGMAGELDFRSSLEQRIAIAGLTAASVADAREALRAQLTPGIAEVLEGLRNRGAHVAAVSGGFVDLIGPALGDLGIGRPNANRFVFDPSGAVIDFDRDNALSRSGGKAEVVAAIKAHTQARRAIMVGDGMTDYEAYAGGAADHFIGFGGVVARDAVKAKAPAWAESVAALERKLLE
jgi:HAD superfamily phosphoserine phosphatase-like hydrolase